VVLRRVSPPSGRLPATLWVISILYDSGRSGRSYLTLAEVFLIFLGRSQKGRGRSFHRKATPGMGSGGGLNMRNTHNL
jgi:hypothetical protein